MPEDGLAPDAGLVDFHLLLAGLAQQAGVEG
jgi:hypothetical protein